MKISNNITISGEQYDVGSLSAHIPHPIDAVSELIGYYLNKIISMISEYTNNGQIDIIFDSYPSPARTMTSIRIRGLKNIKETASHISKTMGKRKEGNLFGCVFNKDEISIFYMLGEYPLYKTSKIKYEEILDMSQFTDVEDSTLKRAINNYIANIVAECMAYTNTQECHFEAIKYFAGLPINSEGRIQEQKRYQDSDFFNFKNNIIVEIPDNYGIFLGNEQVI